MTLRHVVTLSTASLAIGTAAAQTLPAPASAPVVTAGAQLILDGVANVAGGVRRDTQVLTRLDGYAQIDGTGFGADWLAARADIGVMNGRRVSNGLVGDIQGVDNIEGVRAFRIHNAWIWADVGPGGVEAGAESSAPTHRVRGPRRRSSSAISDRSGTIWFCSPTSNMSSRPAGAGIAPTRLS